MYGRVWKFLNGFRYVICLWFLGRRMCVCGCLEQYIEGYGYLQGGIYLCDGYFGVELFVGLGNVYFIYVVIEQRVEMDVYGER